MFGRKKKSEIQELKNQLDVQNNKYDTLMTAFSSLQYETFDGEKQAGELGTATELIPDYYGARIRAWGLQLTNDVAKLTMNKWSTWLVGRGLRFNCNLPKEKYLQNVNRDELTEDIEFRFRNYMQSKRCDYGQMENLHQLAKIAQYNAYTSGDVLCVLRIINGSLTVQLVDGANVATPLNYDFENSNEILDGVEYDSTGRHVAYWVWTSGLRSERVSAFDPVTGLKMAFMVYGSKFRLNETRGLPLLIEDFEKIKNLERYIDATIKSAELSSELVFVNEHDNTSTGKDVFKDAAIRAVSSTSSNSLAAELPNPKCFQKNLAKMTRGMALNNTIGATLKMFNPDSQKEMPDFLESNLKLVLASANIPYEVALMVYGSNYSASRAAIKDWEHNLKVARASFEEQFYKPFYQMWLYNEILNNRIFFDQLLDAYFTRDYVMINALNKSTFTGASVPSIDPLKEVRAVRKAMGDTTTPLMTGEKGAEIISQEDFNEIQQQVKMERQNAVGPLNTEES